MSEQSVQDSRPVDFYRITLGSQAWFYTNSSRDETLGTQLYVHQQIDRGAISRSQDNKTEVLSVLMPTDNPFALLYANIVPSEEASMTVIRAQRGDLPSSTLARVIFQGTVQNVDFSKTTHAELGVRSVDSADGRTVPTVHFQRLCNHFVYSPGCGVDPTGFTHIGNVAAASGDTITVAGLSDFAVAAGEGDGFFFPGFIKLAALPDSRGVWGHTGDVITVMYPFPFDIVGQSVEVAAGCDHDVFGNCANRFNNQLEAEAFPFIPTEDDNPFVSGIRPVSP